jgi:FMN phosphatase YigB (HAD superfamily)
MDFSRIRALLIDIDDTVTRVKPGGPPEGRGLFDVLRDAGVELLGLAPDEVEARIAAIQKEIVWWHWADFIVALGLRPKAFWDFAYDRERRYLESTGPDIRPALERLHAAGTLLYVTSNNPCSGILHKLRIAGLGDMNRADLFSRLFGPPLMQAMKWEPVFWQKVMAHIALDGDEVAVVGDSLRDDYEAPRAAGICGAFLINRTQDLSAGNTDSLFYVTDFTRIADLLLGTPAKAGCGA